MRVFIDTELWIFSRKVPDPSKFMDSSKYEKMKEIHNLSNSFFSERLQKDEILMTHHQLCEIYHALAFRGLKIPKKDAIEFCNKLIDRSFITLYNNSIEDIKRSFELSTESGIHIWDYLCILPLYKDVDLLYSCDKHFQHSTFRSLGVIIENPLNEWLIL